MSEAVNALPTILYDRDVCVLLDISLTTLKKLRRQHVFPIPELPKLDKRHRYSRRDVERYLDGETRGSLSLARRRA